MRGAHILLLNPAMGRGRSPAKRRIGNGAGEGRSSAGRNHLQQQKLHVQLLNSGRGARTITSRPASNFNQVVNDMKVPAKSVRIAEPVLRAIRQTVGTYGPETGGVLGIDVMNGDVVAFDYDAAAQTTRTTYSPDVTRANKLLRQVWAPMNIKFGGFVHSHPGVLDVPSQGDEHYAAHILEAVKSIDSLLMPIVLPRATSSRWRMRMYIAKRVGSRLEVEERGVEVVRGGPYFISDGERIECAGAFMGQFQKWVSSERVATSAPVVPAKATIKAETLVRL